jgi:BED zinc finger
MIVCTFFESSDPCGTGKEKKSVFCKPSAHPSRRSPHNQCPSYNHTRASNPGIPDFFWHRSPGAEIFTIPGFRCWNLFFIIIITQVLQIKSNAQLNKKFKIGSLNKFCDMQQKPSQTLRETAGGFGKCKICHKILKTAGKSTSGLHKHLSAIHFNIKVKRHPSEIAEPPAKQSYFGNPTHTTVPVQSHTISHFANHSWLVGLI